MLEHISLAGALYSRAKRVGPGIGASVQIPPHQLPAGGNQARASVCWSPRQGYQEQRAPKFGVSIKSPNTTSPVWLKCLLHENLLCIVPHRNLGSQINTSITICQSQQFCTEESMSLHDSSTVHGDVVISVSLALSLSQRLPIFLLDTGNKAYYFCLSQ